jgi:aminoglycoside 6'-N-acetyltransferase
MTVINLRKATVEDIDLLKHWDKQQHVIDCDPDDEWDWESELQKDPEWREQLVADKDGEPIGFIQIIDPFHEETHYWGEIEENKRAIDIWIGEEANLNKGYGTQMMNLAIQRCFSVPEVDAIFIDPLKTNTKAHRFYARLGFEFLEERIFDGKECFVYVLKREL